MDTQEYLDMLKNSAKGRAAFYEYLSLVFRFTPEKSFLGTSKKLLPHFRAFADETSNISMQDGVKLLEEYVNTEETSDNMLILEFLNMQYTSMFLLGMNSVPLAESVHLSPDHLIKQEPWEKVLLRYHIRSFKKPATFKETEDHISMELLFMQKMCELTAGVIEEGKADKLPDIFEEQRYFIEEHLAKWVPALSAMIVAKSGKDDIPLYKSAALILNGFIESEKELLKAIAEK